MRRRSHGRLEQHRPGLDDTRRQRPDERPGRCFDAVDHPVDQHAGHACGAAGAGGQPVDAADSTVPPTTPPTSAATPTSTPTSTPSSVPTSTTPQSEALPTLDGGTCLVGPPGGTGEVFSRNSAGVELEPAGGLDGGRRAVSGAGESAWNALAQQCFNGLGSCPSRQLAIVLDGIVQSAPVVQAPSFSGEVSITGQFAEEEARSLARVLNRGAFPVDVEVQRVETVSPTLGQDSLRASVFAGLVGVVLLLAVLVVFYRRLTLLIALGLIVWGMLDLQHLGGHLADHQLRPHARWRHRHHRRRSASPSTATSSTSSGSRTRWSTVARCSNSAARSFRATWRTILAANFVAFIAAAVLFVLSVGSVRGFALYLGITTICDVVVLYFFTRPAVILLAVTGRLDRRDTFGLGLARHDLRSPATQAAAGRSLAGARSLASERWCTDDHRDDHRRRGTDHCRPGRHHPMAAADHGPDGDRLLGSAADLAGHLLVLLVITGASLITRGLVLGIDFAGGVAWDVPAGDLTVDEAAAILEDNGLSASSAKIQERRSDSGDLIKIQVEDQPTDVRVRRAGGLRRGRRRRPR